MIIWQESRLKEKLEKVSDRQFKLLKAQMANDAELNYRLTSPMGEIDQYKFLVPTGSYESDYSLFNALQFIFSIEKRQNFYFSKSGDKFTGFVVYEDNGRVIDKVKMASFFDDSFRVNPVLAKDLILLVLKNIDHRERIEWRVDFDNQRAIKQYNELLTKLHFIWTCEPVSSSKFFLYAVTGREK